MKVLKPNKRVIFYWFFDKGFFLLVTALLLSGTYLRYFTAYYTLTLFVMQFLIVTIVFSILLLVYDWLMTEYYFFDTHLLIKDLDGSSRIKYADIVDVGYYGSLLQHLTGTTNLAIRKKDRSETYLRGIRDYKGVEKELLSRTIKP